MGWATNLLVGRVLEILVVLVVVLDLLRREGVLRIDMIVVTIVVVLVLRKAKSIIAYLLHTLLQLY